MKLLLTMLPAKICFAVVCMALTAFAFSGFVCGQDQRRANEIEALDVTISMKRDGFPCGYLPVNGKDLSGCPAYTISIAGDGTVTYEGVASVKTRGKRRFAISVRQVERLLADFERIKFFDLQERYTEKRMPDGTVATIDHSNGTTITLRVGDKTKNVFNFYGAPEELNALQEKLDRIGKDLQR